MNALIRDIHNFLLIFGVMTVEVKGDNSFPVSLRPALIVGRGNNYPPGICTIPFIHNDEKYNIAIAGLIDISNINKI